MASSTTALLAALFFTLVGIGHSACWVPVVTVVQRWVSERRRGTALSIVDLGSASGIAVWSLLMPVIVGAFDWRAGWISLGLLGLVVAGMNFFMVRSRPPEAMGALAQAGSPGTRIPVREIYRDLLRDRRFWLIGLSYMLIAFAILIPYAFLAIYATQALGIPYKSATGLIAVIAVSGVFGKLTLGHLSDIIGRVRVMMLCGVLVAAGGMGMAFARDFSMLTVSVMVFGIGYGAIWPVYAASARDFFPQEQAGSVVGLWTLYLGIGSILSPVMAGWVIDTTGRYAWAFVLVFLGALVSLALLIPLYRDAAPGK